MAKAMKLSESETVEIYRAARQVASVDGTIPRSLQEKMITFQKKSLKVEREVTPESVYDFSVVRAIKAELPKS